jgi:hypothetical protein
MLAGEAEALYTELTVIVCGGRAVNFLGDKTNG